VALFPWFGPWWFGRKAPVEPVADVVEPVVEPVVEAGRDQSAERFENLCYGHGHGD
jgi:hypothetical protein